METLTLAHYKNLPLAQQVAQMLVVRASGYLFDHQIQYPQWEPPNATLHRWVEELGVGGVILLGGSAAEIAVRSRQLQDWANIPLLIAADVEEGVGQRFSGAVWLPPPMALGAIYAAAQASGDTQRLHQALAYARAMGSITAQEALAIGVNWVLAPTCDVNNNPVNPVINVRAFGETPDVVGALIEAFLQGAQQHAALTCAKHFPGHGDTATDSHLNLPLIAHSRQRLTELELPPFKRAIASGVDAVMSAHLLIPALDEQYPATLSHRILTQELRNSLGFEGLVVTDALIMGAIAKRYGVNEAPVMAVEAGADILMMPIDPEGAIAAVCEAVESGRIAHERILASLERICRAKQKLASVEGGTSHAWENVPAPPIQLDVLAKSEAIATAQGILRDSMVVRQPEKSLVNGFEDGSSPRNLIILDSALDRDFLTGASPAIALPKQQGYTLQILDSYSPPIEPQLVSLPSSPTLLQLFIRGNPFRSSAGLTQMAATWLDFLVQTHQLQALVMYGSPYLLDQFLPQIPASVPYVFTYGQMPEAQTIALDALFGDASLG